MMLERKKMLSQQRGFSLLEGLVAFLILSIGLLGIGSLQLISLKAGKTAELRTIAVIKSEEILERIRTNQAATLEYISLEGDPGNNFGCNATKSCTSAEMARDDIFNWKTSLVASLPTSAAPKASRDVVAPVPGTMPTAKVTVTISWQERNTETGTITMDNMNYSVEAHVCVNTTC
mgnify:CR=1 FL=1